MYSDNKSWSQNNNFIRSYLKLIIAADMYGWHFDGMSDLFLILEAHLQMCLQNQRH